MNGPYEVGGITNTFSYYHLADAIGSGLSFRVKLEEVVIDYIMTARREQQHSADQQRASFVLCFTGRRTLAVLGEKIA